MPGPILIVDDEQDMLSLLKRSLEPELGRTVETAPSGEAALEALSRTRFDLVLADIKMRGMDGFELLSAIKSATPEMTVIMMTAYGDIDTAVKAMKQGAYDFITKPFDHDTLVVRLEKALERAALLTENRLLKRQCREIPAFRDLVGESPAIRKVFETIETVAKTDLTVLITGESGTGKDLAAKAVHALSSRNNNPYVAVNCPAVPEHILESELFGYRKGAFTHATHNRTGLFQEAHTGSIFLDEIGDVSPAIQTKLLRVIQEKEFKPLGDNRPVKVDVRIISSTNRDLAARIHQGAFREDFFHRLSVLPIHMPPLRERQGDIPLIVNHLIRKHCKKLGQPLKTAAPELMDALSGLPWKGNVRELENVIIRGVLYSSREIITVRDVGVTDAPSGTAIPATSPDLDIAYKQAKEKALIRFNRTYIGELLSECEGNVTRAAKRAGLERQSLQQIMRRYGIKSEDYRNN